jgi:hypothetical protein
MEAVLVAQFSSDAFLVSSWKDRENHEQCHLWWPVFRARFETGSSRIRSSTPKFSSTKQIWRKFLTVPDRVVFFLELITFWYHKNFKKTKFLVCVLLPSDWTSLYNKRKAYANKYYFIRSSKTVFHLSMKKVDSRRQINQIRARW